MCWATETPRNVAGEGWPDVMGDDIGLKCCQRWRPDVMGDDIGLKCCQRWRSAKGVHIHIFIISKADNVGENDYPQKYQVE